MANAKIQPFTSLDQSKHHCYTLSTTCTLFKLASEVGPRTIIVCSNFKLTLGSAFGFSSNFLLAEEIRKHMGVVDSLLLE